MEKRVHFYVSRKNLLTWLMALCLVGSAVARIWYTGVKGAGDLENVWSQIVLPVAATLLYVLIALLNGQEQFYKTAIPAWMMCIYYAIIPHQFIGNNSIMLGLYCAVLLLCGALYTIITAGRVRRPWFLILIFGGALALTIYTQCPSPGMANAAVVSPLPWGDLLLFSGLLFMVFAIRVHPQSEYHPTWGDRSDGRRIRTEPAMNQVSPYIMVTRNTSTNFFEEAFEITNLDRYVRAKRREGLTNFGLIHVLLAAYARGLCRYPALNRFIAGQKVYTHGDDIQFCLTVKKEMSTDSPETVIKVHLNPHDTALDVYKKIQAEVENAKNTPLDSGMDNTAALLTLIPGVFLKFVVWLLKTMDYFGCLPKFLLEVSPFHGSVFFTSMGSLGIPPIYHHLYDFGNLPVFCSFGMKRRALELQEDGTIVPRKYVDCRFTLDERICDGYYYAAFFKHYKRLLAHPEILDNPPEEVLKDID